MIDARIPFSTDGNLGKAYNRAVAESQSEWVLLLDHDVLILHPNWRHLCERVILDNPDAGLFTCWASKIGSPVQQALMQPAQNAPMRDHRAFARATFHKYGYTVSRLTPFHCKTSGFFLLVKKEAWRGAKDGFFGVDWNLKDRITHAGYSVYRIDGLYCFHLKDREGSWVDNIKTSKDF